MALKADVVLRELRAAPGGDLHLRADEIDAGDDLGDRVLDLDPGVHLHEVVGAVGREQAFDRPRRAVAGRARGVDADLPDAVAQLVRHAGGRRLLDQLLVAALDRAVALAQVDDVAVRVGEHLHLDVTRVLVADDRLPVLPQGIPRNALPGPACPPGAASASKQVLSPSLVSVLAR